MKNLKALFDPQLSHSFQLLKEKNLKGLIYPFWSFTQGFQALGIQSAYHKVIRKKERKPIWLYSDRIDAGGDNAEAFFEYCVKHRPDIEHVFIINDSSSDATRLSKLGQIIEPKSNQHKLFFLLAEKYFLSCPENYFLNPFGLKKPAYNDLPTPDLVFLQHGITQNDLSDWLKRDKMNFSRIVTAAQKEYDAFLDAPYGYTKSNLIKCGFPRFDKLTNAPENKIVIMPTWRQNITGKVNSRTCLPEYNPEFKKSDYFKFYFDLLNDKKLACAMEKRGVTGEFYLHQSLAAQIDDFSSPIFEIMHPPYNYTQAFATGNLLVTDYSSVAFDFGYLGKPVLYCQFDKDSIYGSDNHTFTKNYISAEEDGFGPVVYDYASIVKEILCFMEHDFSVSPKYSQRSKSFYFYHDRNNCKRLLAAISKET